MSDQSNSPSRMIDERIKELVDWRGKNTRRAIDFREGDKIHEEALKALIRAAVALNASRAR